MFDVGQELVLPAHLKAQLSDFSEDSKKIKTNENQWLFYRFTSKAYSAAISNRIFHLYQL